MKWHDCKTEPPKVSGHYIVAYKKYWEEACFYLKHNKWINIFDEEICPIK